ncbi:3'-5' exonuclease [Psychromonas aquimarina]|uniref:3'-5' exonuclease n=1 Tax=Psychromonas aquimarina TaxID=444919 RepID=UPI0004065AF6|nr:3'-5' exonuclease [Psychromonas aquimarina]
MSNADTLVILDFETTGLSPDMGDRAIEIGAVLLENGQVTDRFQELMNPGISVSGFIEGFTGISNAMLKDASPCADVMHRFADFIADHNLVAHNASFDKRFLDAELKRISRNYSGRFVCSMLLARRLFQNAPNHKLATLVEYTNAAADDALFHRALYDSEMTAKVWLAMLGDIQQRYAIENIPFELLYKLTKTPAKSVDKLLSSWK